MEEKEELVKLSFYISKEAYPSVEKYLRANGYEPIEDVDVPAKEVVSVEDILEFSMIITSDRAVIICENGKDRMGYSGGVIFRQKFFGKYTYDEPKWIDELEIHKGDVFSLNSFSTRGNVEVVQLID